MMAISDCARIVAAGLEPAHARHVHVEQDEIEPLVAELLQRRLAALGIVHLVALAGQRHAHDPPNLRVVVDDENPAGAHDAGPPRGSDSVNVVPASGELEIVSVPPCARAICWTMARPIPVPGMWRACAPR